MINIRTKPLSVNECWQGRRFKTPKYTSYEKELLYLLPKLSVSKKDLDLVVRFGVSSKNSDLDNLLKPFIDVLQKKYGFNDKKIKSIGAFKENVKKGLEYIEFSLNSLST